jgi:hypothetical protein
MDIEKLTHSGYKVSVVTAVVLSTMVVVLTAFLGRGALNLKASLVLEEPSDVTVIAVVEPKLESDVSISNIDFLRKEKAIEGKKPLYAYQVRTSNNEYHLVKLGYDEERQQWALMNYELLHADPRAADESVQETETQAQQ